MEDKNTLYHSRSLQSAVDILKTKRFRLATHFAKRSERKLAVKDYQYFLSTARVHNNGFLKYALGGGSQVTFVLKKPFFDHSNRYSIRPVSYFASGHYEERRSEHEERIFSNLNYIPVNLQTVKEIYVFLAEYLYSSLLQFNLDYYVNNIDKKDLSREEITANQLKQFVRQLRALNVKCYIFHDPDDFLRRRFSKAIPISKIVIKLYKVNDLAKRKYDKSHVKLKNNRSFNKFNSLQEILNKSTLSQLSRNAKTMLKDIRREDSPYYVEGLLQQSDLYEIAKRDKIDNVVTTLIRKKIKDPVQLNDYIWDKYKLDKMDQD